MIFSFSFGLNVLWEKAHSYLYVHYQSGRITNFILLRAAFWDAVYILSFAILFRWTSVPRELYWLVLPLGVSLSIVIEWWALRTNRWAYRSTMPLLPILNVGVTPALQIGLIAYGIFYFFGL